MAREQRAGDTFYSGFFVLSAAADLSVSMGGYNTTMNILASGVPALVWPFGQNREQRLRAERLADLGALRVLEDEDLHPDRLAVIMDQWISSTDAANRQYQSERCRKYGKVD